MLDLSKHLEALLAHGGPRVDRCLEQAGIRWESEPIAPEALTWPPKIVERAFELTRSLGSNEVGHSHVFLAIIDACPAQVNELLGLDRDKCGELREALYSALRVGG